MLSRWLTLVVWALVAASGVAWGVKLFARPLAVPAQAALALPGVAAGGDLSRLFGVEAASPPVADQAPAPAESSRFKLIGVVAPAAAAARAQGVALIAVDGKMPRAFRVGALVDGDLVLQSVQARAVAIGPRGSPALVALELPPLPQPATGVPGAAPVVLAPPGLPAAAAMVPVPPQLTLQPAPPIPGAAPNLGVFPPGRARGMRTLSAPIGVVQVPAPNASAQADESHQPETAPTDVRNLR